MVTAAIEGMINRAASAYLAKLVAEYQGAKPTKFFESKIPEVTVDVTTAQAVMVCAARAEILKPAISTLNDQDVPAFVGFAVQKWYNDGGEPAEFNRDRIPAILAVMTEQIEDVRRKEEEARKVTQYIGNLS